MEDKNRSPQNSAAQQELLTQLKEVEEKLADLVSRWPFHSVQPRMVAEREDLEEERDRLSALIYRD
jgi:hypothetical protein